ncbi:MAG: CynX/NimT family MFS transporter [Nostocoides sp.]
MTPPNAEPAPPISSGRPLLILVIGYAAVAFNLRTLMSGLPPLRSDIVADLHLSNTAAGVLTTLPVLCMGLFAPPATRLGARWGIARSVTIGTAVLAVGNLMRFAGAHPVALYGGTLVAGTGIALVGTLLPGFVKSAFPASRAGLATGIQMLAMMGGAAIASAIAVPLASVLGAWPASLGMWGVIAVLGCLLWLPIDRRAHLASRTRRGLDPVVVAADHGLPWRSLTAWLVALYLTLQSWQFYSSLAWLAPTYVDQGWTASSAGLLLALFTAAQFVSGLAAPWLSDQVRDWRVLLIGFAITGLIGELGVAVAPQHSAALWSTLIGLGQGAAFALGLVLLVRFARTPRASALLTAMAFLVSYTLAAFGPTVMGRIRDVTGAFTSVWFVLAGVCVAQILVSLVTGPALPPVGEGR